MYAYYLGAPPLPNPGSTPECTDQVYRLCLYPYLIIIIKGRQSKNESGKAQSRGAWGTCFQKYFETAHSDMLSEGSFGLEYCMKGARPDKCSMIKLVRDQKVPFEFINKI